MNNKVKCFAKGEVIFKEGTYEAFMYDLIEGNVGIYANYGEAGEKLLTELTTANGSVIIGEMGLIDAMPRSATAVALEDVKVCVITGDEFGEYFKENPDAILMIMQNMSKRIRRLSQDYLDACHVVAEAVESEKSGKEKTSWFKKIVNKFIEDYKASAEMAAQNDDYYYYHDYIDSIEYIEYIDSVRMRHSKW